MVVKATLYGKDRKTGLCEMVSHIKRVGRTKIVCTIGPASCRSRVLRRLIAAGMDVVRLNFSHGTHEEHLAVLHRVRRLSERMGQPVAVMQDLSGAKIRLGEIENGECVVGRNGRLILTIRKIVGDAKKVGVNRRRLPQEVNPGDPILLNDGAVRLRVIEVGPQEILCKVLTGGTLGSRKGINLPDTALGLRALTVKDRRDLRFGLENDVDFVALSFVRTASDVKKLRKIIAAAGKDIPIIAKIERREALDNLESVAKEADGLMVARGDLGVETDLESVPMVQKRIIRLSNRLGKPVITATQMLESMVANPTPTRAEVTDVANAILDGTDAVMLSGETAVGQHVVKSVQIMSKIAMKTEEGLPSVEGGKIILPASEGEVPGAIAHAAGTMAREIGVRAIVACTIGGGTARLIARHRPRVPILVASPSPATVRRLCLTWGVFPVLVKESERSEETVSAAIQAFLSRRLLRKGDKVVVVAGISPWTPGGANLLRVMEV
ncbi:pyruvate kinase [bacterium]|nr:pyruvate kinase [bacterium]